jgi:hypothetical protein
MRHRHRRHRRHHRPHRSLEEARDLLFVEGHDAVQRHLDDGDKCLHAALSVVDELLGAERLGVVERRRAGHHLGRLAEQNLHELLCVTIHRLGQCNICVTCVTHVPATA